MSKKRLRFLVHPQIRRICEFLEAKAMIVSSTEGKSKVMDERQASARSWS